MRTVNSWGRVIKEPHHITPLFSDSIVDIITRNCSSKGLAYGMGRSYGDSCLNPGGRLWSTETLDKFISFDSATGEVTCEAGVQIRDIQRIFINRGWMLPVTPGTQFVTVGGAIANDVHGKNHHRFGSFCNHVSALTLVRTDGEIIECGPERNREWFSATAGGLGLTGVIVKASIKLRRVPGPWLITENIPFSTIDEFFTLANLSENEWEYTVSWVDCIAGRGIFMRGNSVDCGIRSELKNVKISMPVVPPFSLVNSLTLRPFNSVYYLMNKNNKNPSIVHYKPFFYPLDNIMNWNRMYGPKGFYQYQCVIPFENGVDAVKEMLKEISKSGEGSFLSVLKTFGGQQSKGLLSFPRPGITFALDFSNKGHITSSLFKKLDAIVVNSKGRLYVAKDGRMPKNMFEGGYPSLSEFIKFRDKGISSGFSRRLMEI